MDDLASGEVTEMTEEKLYMPPGKRMPEPLQIGPREILLRQKAYEDSRREWRELNGIPDKFRRG